MRRLALAAALMVALAGCHHTPAKPIVPTTTRPAPTTTRPVGKCATPASYLAKGRPDPCLTPGMVRTSDPKVICVPGYASRVRGELTAAQWAARRAQVEQRYGLHANPGEIDHLLPLEGGGSNDLTNLWPEAAPQYKAKDQAEGTLHQAICKPGITVAETRRLQTAFLRQWGGTP